MRQALFLLATSAVLAGCASFASGPTATATLAPTAGSTAAGTVQFAQRGERVQVSGEVRGLRPNAEHGFHVHEKGDCSSPDGTSAGGHYNPNARPHGRHGAGAHHVGDLPSLRADANGVARFSFESASISVGPGAGDVTGRGLIVHRDPDDFTTQPTGNAGARLACAVIVQR
ncbi:MAG TPA: superoxide dismutase family protein [Ramlibacter sp.]|nr:superoxide dismutase family protein [Ramlibacter sp.]